MKKAYISGAITGTLNAAKDFYNAELQLINEGYDVVNPMKLNHDHDKSWESYMKVCIKAMCECDEVFMLYKWETSKGANRERSCMYSWD